MQPTEIILATFSPTGGTKHVVSQVASGVATKLKLPIQSIDFTLPDARKDDLSFKPNHLVLLALPVYAGRIPNVLLPWLSRLKGNGALAASIVVFGNRNFDDALIEWKDLLQIRGFQVIAGAAFVAEHAFSHTLAGGRPDADDDQAAKSFGFAIGEKCFQNDRSAVVVPGCPHPYRAYYQPKDSKGKAVDIRKVTPCTDDSCVDCKRCVQLCPMGSIAYEDVGRMQGICIKCCACIKGCPSGAKHFDDPAFLHHKNELEEDFRRRAEAVYFL